jgi:hypothetical protein
MDHGDLYFLHFSEDNPHGPPHYDYLQPKTPPPQPEATTVSLEAASFHGENTADDILVDLRHGSDQNAPCDHFSGGKVSKSCHSFKISKSEIEEFHHRAMKLKSSTHCRSEYRFYIATKVNCVHKGEKHKYSLNGTPVCVKFVEKVFSVSDKTLANLFDTGSTADHRGRNPASHVSKKDWKWVNQLFNKEPVEHSHFSMSNNCFWVLVDVRLLIP